MGMKIAELGVGANFPCRKKSIIIQPEKASIFFHLDRKSVSTFTFWIGKDGFSQDKLDDNSRGFTNLLDFGW